MQFELEANEAIYKRYAFDYSITFVPVFLLFSDSMFCMVSACCKNKKILSEKSSHF